MNGLGLLTLLSTAAMVILFAGMVFRKSNPWWIFLLGIAVLCLPIVLDVLAGISGPILLYIMWFAIPLFTVIISKKPRLRGLAHSLFWVSCILIVLFGFISFYIAVMPDLRNETRIRSCVSNLKQIGLALHMYAQDHGDKFPERLIDLYPKYVTDLRLFICVAKHIEPNYYNTDKSKDPFLDPFYKTMLSGESMDYQYTKGLIEKSPPTTILAQDKQGNHLRGSFNVLYLDGHVETKNIPSLFRKFYLKGIPIYD